LNAIAATPAAFSLRQGFFMASGAAVSMIGEVRQFFK
jgi:hypothetical protein